jgi:hypothetical protein
MARGARDAASVVSLARVGPGGAGVLRASFDAGAGGWFTVLRVEGGLPSTSSVPFEARLVSEALASDEAAHRFAIAIERVGGAVASR